MANPKRTSGSAQVKGASSVKSSVATAKGTMEAGSATSVRMKRSVARRVEAGGPRIVQRQRRYEQMTWYRGRLPIIGTLVAVALVITLFVTISRNQNQATAAGIGQPVSATVLQQVTQVKPSVITTVGTGGLTDPLHTISGAALTENGKPEFLYVGGEFCPYCAAERWSMLNALSRFGTFSNVHYMRSAATDGNLATVTFYQSSYTSNYISVEAIENEDRNQNQLQSLTDQQSQLFTTIGGDGFPFVDIAGQYANGAGSTPGGGYDQSLLTGLSWQQISAKLSNPKDPLTQGIIGNANYLTAAICMTTNQQPGSVCLTTPIQTIEQQLPKGQ